MNLTIILFRMIDKTPKWYNNVKHLRCETQRSALMSSV